MRGKDRGAAERPSVHHLDRRRQHKGSLHSTAFFCHAQPLKGGHVTKHPRDRVVKQGVVLGAILKAFVAKVDKFLNNRLLK